jgi:hypothetical protein
LPSLGYFIRFDAQDKPVSQVGGPSLAYRTLWLSLSATPAREYKKKKKNSWMQASLEKSTHIAIQKKGYRIKCPKDKSVLS